MSPDNLQGRAGIYKRVTHVVPIASEQPRPVKYGLFIFLHLKPREELGYKWHHELRPHSLYEQYPLDLRCTEKKKKKGIRCEQETWQFFRGYYRTSRNDYRLTVCQEMDASRFVLFRGKAESQNQLTSSRLLEYRETITHLSSRLHWLQNGIQTINHL